MSNCSSEIVSLMASLIHCALPELLASFWQCLKHLAERSISYFMHPHACSPSKATSDPKKESVVA